MPRNTNYFSKSTILLPLLYTQKITAKCNLGKPFILTPATWQEQVTTKDSLHHLCSASFVQSTYLATSLYTTNKILQFRNSRYQTHHRELSTLLTNCCVLPSKTRSYTSIWDACFVYFLPVTTIFSLFPDCLSLVCNACMSGSQGHLGHWPSNDQPYKLLWFHTQGGNIDWEPKMRQGMKCDWSNWLFTENNFTELAMEFCFLWSIEPTLEMM